MSIEQEKMIVESLSSIYPMQKFEEDAIDTVLDALPRWIPCSKRLPEEDVDVLCKTFSEARLVASYGILNPWDTEKGWITAEFNRFSKEMVKAWMPIPE